MRPLDPRLFRQAATVRRHLLVCVALGVTVTGLVLAQAVLLARLLSASVAVAPALTALAAVVAARALVSAGGETSALRAAASVQSRLRRLLVERSVCPRPAAPAGEVVTLATRGLDSLDAYFARYLPQLVLACLTPVAVLAVVAVADPLSAVVIGLTLPLIPVFMVLIGLHTRAHTERQWHLLQRLGGHFLDVIQGLPTLKIFNRAEAQATVVADVTAAHRRATMRTLRVAFLSAFALELLATLAVALVAVEVGLRLLGGGMPYRTALLVLLLAPEAYLPLRAVGAQFHASMEGATAARRALDLIDAPDEPSRTGQCPTDGILTLEDVTVRHPGRDAPVLDRIHLRVRPGERIVVTGASGAGKSTLLAVLLGFVRPEGRTSFAHMPPERWRRGLAWVPQHPHLFDGSIADNIRLADPDAPRAAVRRAASLAGAAEFIEALPRGYDSPADGLSAGQRQRVALARTFLRDAPVLLLDEPTAHLDADAAAAVREAVERLMAGRTVVLVTHDLRWTHAADRVIEINGGRLRELEAAA